MRALLWDEVDKHGCPLDVDNDGLLITRTLTNTLEGEIVNTQGDLVDYELIEDRWINYQELNYNLG